MSAPKPTKEELTELRRAGLTREQIRKKYGLSLSALKRMLHDFDVVPRKSKTMPKASKREKPRYVALDEGLSLMERCKQILGDRMGEDHRGYLLDGRPASSMQVQAAAGY